MNNSKKTLFKELYYQSYRRNPLKLHNLTKDNISFLQRLGLQKSIKVHTGCVNTLSWNSTGQYILSGSDDLHLIVTNGHNYKVATKYQTSHRANIFSAKFLPHCNDQQIISCSGDGVLLYSDLVNLEETHQNQFKCHIGTTYEVITVPNDPCSFLSCGEDGTVRWYDLRTKTKCLKPSCKDDILIFSNSAVTALGINPTSSYQLSVGCSDSTVRLYDRRFLSTYLQRCGPQESNPYSIICPPELENRRHRVTSLSYSSDGQELLVSYSCDHLYLFNLYEQNIKPLNKPRSNWNKIAAALSGKRESRSPPPVRRLRLRGDWSDTGPDARPEREVDNSGGDVGQARPQLQDTLMQRMTDVLSRMLNDPMTRAALSAGVEENLDGQQQANQQAQMELDAGGNRSGEVEEAAAAPAPASIAADGRATDDDVPEVDGERNRGEISAGSREHAVLHSLASGARARRNHEPRRRNPNPPNNNHTNPPVVQVARNDTSTTAQSSSTPPTTSSGAPAVLADDSWATEAAARVNTSLLTQQLRNRLTLLRHLRRGFIEYHGGEPSVSLRYSGQSTSNATINLSSAAGASGAGGGGPDDYLNEDGLPSGLLGRGAYGLDQDTDMQLDYPDDCDIDAVKLENLEYLETLREVQEFSDPQLKNKYVGHRNARTMIKEATFWGDEHVMSGSDCGHVFVWNRRTAKLCMLLQADSHVVNCLQPHPTLPLLATSGIDYDIKIWGSVLAEPTFDEALANGLIRRNEIMLEETRDTITVPAAFMIRMLACLNQIRHGNRPRMRSRDDEPPSDER